eukprot:TRINITY_DN4283_c2_g1_i1.p1 TRINITY_DN4283_c2_g1~~TRINITY_DN4283_c2_g1_i1.p1  ORF type:complete len:516 (+),score=129.52 TRINITY_DN4283_c2_g1_i1:157-1704(+)
MAIPRQHALEQNARPPTVKQEREAMKRALAECSEQFDNTERELKKAAADEVRAERSLQHSRGEHQAFLSELEAAAPPGSVQQLAGETQRLVEALRSATNSCNEAERRTSFGLYERWRQRLDLHLCAGGSVESSNTMDHLIRDRGYVPTTEVSQSQRREVEAARSCAEVAKQLDTVQHDVAALHHELRVAEGECGELRRRVAEQRRTTNEWWEWHMARLPQYHKDLEKLRQHEAFKSSMQSNVKESRSLLKQKQQDEEAAYADLQRAKDELYRHEVQVQRFFGLIEEYEQEQRHLAQRAMLQPDQAEKIQQVHRFAQRLDEARELRQELESEMAEARKTEAQAEVERQAIAAKIARASEELRAAGEHVAMMREVRSRELGLLGEFEHERKELSRAHAELFVEHERMKSELVALSSSVDLGARQALVQRPLTLIQQPARSFSPLPSAGDDGKSQLAMGYNCMDIPLATAVPHLPLRHNFREQSHQLSNQEHPYWNLPQDQKQQQQQQQRRTTQRRPL